MKKYLIAVGVTSLLIAAQAMASDAASLVGAPETAVAPVEAAETASAPAAVAPAYSNAPARPLMVAGEAGALAASSAAVPVGAEVTASGMVAAVSRVPDRLAPAAPSYNAMLSASSQTGTCNIFKTRMINGETNGAGRPDTSTQTTREQCNEKTQQINTAVFASAGTAATIIAYNVFEDSPASGT